MISFSRHLQILRSLSESGLNVSLLSSASKSDVAIYRKSLSLRAGHQALALTFTGICQRGCTWQAAAHRFSVFSRMELIVKLDMLREPEQMEICMDDAL